MARGGTADPRRLETAAGRTVAEAAADIPRGDRAPTTGCSDPGGGAKRDGDEADSRAASHLRGRGPRGSPGPPPTCARSRELTPSPTPEPPLPAPRDVLGRRSSVVYSPGLWPVRWSAPATISRWSSSARDASARPRSLSDTSRTSSTTSTSPRYR